MLDPHKRSGAKTSTQRKGLRAPGFWLHQAPVPTAPPPSQRGDLTEALTPGPGPVPLP